MVSRRDVTRLTFMEALSGHGPSRGVVSPYPITYTTCVYESCSEDSGSTLAVPDSFVHPCWSDTVHKVSHLLILGTFGNGIHSNIVHLVKGSERVRGCALAPVTSWWKSASSSPCWPVQGVECFSTGPGHSGSNIYVSGLQLMLGWWLWRPLSQSESGRFLVAG